MSVLTRCLFIPLLGIIIGISACRPEVVSPVKSPDEASEPTKPAANIESSDSKTAGEPKVAGKPDVANSSPPPAPKLALPALLKSERIYFRTPVGEKRFQIKPKEADAVKFYDSSGAELCKLTMQSDKLKVKTANDTPLFELKWHGDKVAFKDGTTDKELSKLRFRGKDFEFVEGETTKAKIIHEENGSYRVEDAKGNKIAGLSVSDNRAQLLAADGSELLSCEQTQNPQTLIGFALPDLKPEQQAALFIYFVSRGENSR